MYMQRTTSGAAGNGLYTTIKYLGGAAGIGPGTTIKYLRRTTSAAANNGLSNTTICSGFYSKLRAPHRGTSLGPFVCGTKFPCFVY
jgi:ribose 5-phosphate isomerase